MKTFLLLLAVSLTASEKLDRTYLPPPGAKLSGGVPGNIEVPFEFPKESYSPTQRPQGILSHHPISPDDTRIEVGINRGLGSQVSGIDTGSELSTPGSKVPFDYFQKVPTTTTSYAFTQTTTHPPGDGFDTTPGPFNMVTGFPTTTPFADFSTSVPGFVNFPQGVSQGQQIIPGYHPPNVVDQLSGLGLSPGNIQSSGSTLTSTPGPFGQIHPGLSQGGLNQYQIDTNRPNIIPSTSPNRPAFSSQIPNQNLSQYQINQRPGVSNIGQQSTIAPSVSQGISGLPQYSGNLDGIQVTSTPDSNIYSQSTPGSLPSVSYDGTIQNVPNSNIPSPNLPPRQHLVPQDFVQSGNNVQLGQRPIQNQYQLNEDGKTITNVPQTQRPSLQQSNVEVSQQYPSQINQSGRPIPGRDQTFSTVSPITPVPNYTQFPTTTPGIFPTTYPDGSYQSNPTYPGKSDQVQHGLISRPERPQAESDRNAVILNYDNVITPDGYFAYSYDTSNGIHADESGTSADGVRANGSYSYIGDDGKVYSIVYTADENGFRPRGDHLPTPPPIPEAIQKVIEQVSRDKEAGISDDGTYDEAKYGHKKFESRRRPLKPNKVNIGEYDIADTDEGQFDEIDHKQQTRPYIEGRKPVSSKGNISNKYDESINGQDQLSDDDLDDHSEIPSRRPVSGLPGQKEDISERRRPLGEMHSRRPISGYDETSSLSFDESSESDYENEQGNRLPSRRPGQLPNRIENETSSRGNILPGEKLPSRRPSEQSHDFDTITEDNTFITENNQRFLEPSKYRPIDESMLRRPGPFLSNQFVQEHEQQKFDDTNRRVLNKFPSTAAGSKLDITDSSLRPNVHKQHEVEQSLTGIPTDRPNYYDRYNLNRGRPQVTTTFAPQTDDHRVNVPGKLSSFAQNVLKPTFGQKPNKINQYTDNLSNIDQGSIFAAEANASDVNVPNTISGLEQYNGQPISGQRPSLNKQIPTRPGDDQETAYIAHSDRKPGKVTSIDQNVSTPTFTQRPGQINHYVPTTGSGFDEGTVFTPQNESELVNSQTLMPGKVYENIRRPIFGQRLGQQNRPTTVTPIEKETGYEYIPPQRKFDDIPKVRNQEGNDAKYFEQKGDVRKPFMIPGTSDKEEDYEHIEENRKQPRPSLRPGQYTDEPSKYSSTGSTRLPSYQQTHTPARPQDQFESTRLNHQGGQNIPQGTTRPPQKGTGYFVGKDRDRTGIVPSTTHIPPQDSRFEFTHPNRRPGQQITDQFTPERQYYNIMSTTKMPFQDSSHLEIESSNDNQTPSGLLYQTTYKPTVTISSTTVSDKFRPDSEIVSTGRPSIQISNRRPGTAGKVPSTTYRPGYFTETIDGKHRPIVDASGRPLIESNVSPGFEGTTIRPGTGTQNVRVPFTDNTRDSQPTIQFSSEDDDFISEEVKPGLTKHGRPAIPTGHRGDGSPVFSPYEVSSSTETFIGEDFSGPKQPQRYDPERGYYY